MDTLTKHLSGWTTEDLFSEVLSGSAGNSQALDQIQATIDARSIQGP